MTKKIIRNVIIDTPTKEDFFDGKGHARTATSLAQVIREFDDKDRAIGLDGPWGSGKSSIVEIARQHLETTRKSAGVRHYFFTFDIWKSQGAGFRRSFLEHFVTWALKTFPENRKKLVEIEKGIQGTTREIETNNRPILGWFGIAILVLLPFLPIYYFWAKNTLDNFFEIPVSDDTSWYSTFGDFLGLPPVSLLLLFVLATFVTAAKIFFGGGRDENDKYILNFKTVLSGVLLISSKQHQDHKVTQRIREIDPNDYEFHHNLRDILSVVQSPNTKVVMVLDNIDRLPTKEIMDYWALVRSIFSRVHQSAKVIPQQTITAIVPYDRALIESSINEEDNKESNNKPQPLTKLSSRELFSKTFDEVLTVAPPVLSNARIFFTEKLKYALPEHTSTDDGFRVYRIFCELLRNEGGTTTPRQVVSFVNDLSSLFVLHEGQFPLPTVAVYLAHQDQITNDPTKLNDEANLDPKIVSLASDPELAKHLAAMVFNVDADLAFQVLLDDIIVRAAVADSPDKLEALSRSSGFDLRVDDVVRSNLNEWCSTGDYGAAITNFASMLPKFTGDSKSHVISALVEGFATIESFEIRQQVFDPYLTLFGIADKIDRPLLLQRYLKAAFVRINAQEGLTFDIGQRFAEFLSFTKERLTTLDLENLLLEELGRHAPNSDPNFLFGLSVSIAGAGFKFSDFKSVKIELPKDEAFFTDIATQNPAFAVLAFPQFKQAHLLSNDDWIEVADACLSACKDEEKEPEDIANLLEVVWFSWRSLPEKKRSEIALSDAFSEGLFFRNLGSDESESSERAIANAFFLAGQIGLDQALNNPTTIDPDTHLNIEDVSDEFTKFNGLVLGVSSLTETQADIVSRQAKLASSVVTTWVQFGHENPEHTAVKQVVRKAFLLTSSSYLSLYGLMLYFEYLQDLLGSEEFANVLNRMGTIIKSEKIADTDLKNIPLGFLKATTHAEGEGWKKFHEHVSIELKTIDSAAWSTHIEAMDNTAQLLVEKLSTSGCSLDSAQFRGPLLNLILRVLSGETAPTADQGAIDILMSALDESYHADIWRTIREKITDVTPESLVAAFHLFPTLLSDFVQRGSPIMAGEKDNVIRHILCSALEGRNREVLEIFVQMEYKHISRFKKSSNDSTNTLLDGAMKSFSDSGEDQNWIRTVSEAVMGKKRTKTMWEVWFGT